MITKKQILAEASKRKVLIEKLFLNPEDADFFDRACGSLAVWMANKLISHFKEIVKPSSEQSDYTPQELGNVVNRILARTTYKEQIVGIMDYIRVELNSNISSIKDTKFQELLEISEKWHESLHIGDDAIDYKEEHPIIRDYRKDGIGFYWVDLETRYCDEESERMGHCGRTGGNTLFSLRQYKKLQNNHTLNSSHITAAIGSDGAILQMKGQKNSKPKEEYHPYILDLLFNNENIKGFGYEYDSENDFKISDLTEEQIKELYQKRPDIFKGRKEKKLLVKLGLKEHDPNDDNFVLNIDPDDIYKYVDGGWTVSKYKTNSGGIRTIDVFEALLTDPWTLFDNYYNDDISSAFDYYINDENEKKIREILVKFAQISGYEIQENENLEDLIEELDEENEIHGAIASSINDAEIDSSIDYYTSELRSNLEEYGEVTQMTDEGVIINCNIEKIFKNFDVSDDDIDEYFDRCGESALSCVIIEMVSDYDKPIFSIDDRWTPDVDRATFNENLKDRLSEIVVPETSAVNEEINKMKNMIKKLLS